VIARRVVALVCAWLVVAGPAIGQATGFPQKAVRIVVPYSVGLGPDVVVRTLAEALSAAWKQPVVIENRPGASGIVALSEVRKVGADGHTLFVGDAGSMAVNPYLHASLPYDPARDFAPLSTLFRATFVIFTAGNGRYASLAELIAASRARPRSVSYASLGAGHPSQLAIEAFARAANIELLHVPFKEGGQTLASVANGDVDITVVSMNTAAGMVKAGKLKPLAVGARARLSDHPDLPTIAEAGGPDIEMAPWAALFAVAGTPKAVLEGLHRDVIGALRSPTIRSRIESYGFEVLGSTPQQLTDLVRAESLLYGDLVRSGRLRAE
jgi:tripartite-type tricarboxylate transporter receptor subunit TctC